VYGIDGIYVCVYDVYVWYRWYVWCVYVSVSMQVHTRDNRFLKTPEEGCGSLGVGDPSSCEPPEWVLGPERYKSAKCWYPVPPHSFPEVLTEQ